MFLSWVSYATAAHVEDISSATGTVPRLFQPGFERVQLEFATGKGTWWEYDDSLKQFLLPLQHEDNQQAY